MHTRYYILSRVDSHGKPNAHAYKFVSAAATLMNTSRSLTFARLTILKFIFYQLYDQVLACACACCG
jgi:hypothetical protein